MLTIKRIKEQTEDVLRLLQKKHFEARQYITEVLDLDELRDVVLRRGSQISSLELNKLN